MTDDLTQQLAGVQRAMAAPLPTPEELAAWGAADKAMAARIHRARPGVPLHHVYAVLETLRVIERVDAAKEGPDVHAYVSTGCVHGDLVLPDGLTGHEYCRGMTGYQGAKRGGSCKHCGALCQCPCHRDAPLPTPATPPDCRWPACLPEAEQQQLADQIGAEMRGEDTVPGPDPQPGCGCVDGGPDLTREELQDLVDEQGTDLYQARDVLAFVAEMCDLNDASGRPVTTTDVRGWLRYTGCGGVLVLPDEVVAALATMCGEPPDKAATSSDVPDIAGEP